MSMYEKAVAIKDEIIANRRWLHQNPEIGLDLPKSAAYIKEKLTEMGYEPYDVGKSGVVADLIVDKNKKTIMLRADFDALPITEETGLDFASTNGNMHACGHDLHAASLLGAAKVLIENKDKLNGNVKFMFQPAEEVFLGALSMIEDGLFTKGLIPDFAFATHVNTSVPAGTVQFLPGTMMASSDNFQINVTGKSGHGSSPEVAIDSINIGLHIHLAFQEIIAREKGITEESVLTIGSFQGGQAANIIPEYTTLKGTLRTFDEGLRQRLLARMKKVVPAVAEVYGGKAEIEFVASAPSLYSDPEYTTKLSAYLSEIAPGIIQGEEINTRSAGSEDFSYVSQKVPAMMVWMGARDDSLDAQFPLHHAKVIFNEEAVINAAATYAHVAENALKNL